MLVDEAYVLGQIRRELLQVVEDLLEVLLNHRDQLCELDVADAGDHEVSHGVVLVPDEQGKLCFEAFHDIGAAAAIVFVL